MAIQPIDAQVLFSRLNQMGKEQAEQKDGQLHSQLVQGQEIAKRTAESDHRVSETTQAEGDDVRRVKDEGRRRGQEKKSGKEAEAEDGNTDEDVPQESVREAYLGQKIDITG